MRGPVAALMALSLAVAVPSAADQPTTTGTEPEGERIEAGVASPMAASRGGFGMAAPDGSCPDPRCAGRGDAPSWGTPLAALGGALGALVKPAERRETLPRQRLRVSVRPILRLRGVGVRVAVSF